MAARRIVAKLAARIADAAVFHGEALGMRVLMDHGGIVRFAGDVSAQPKLSVGTEGGSGTPVPDLTVEVGDVAAVHQRMLDTGHANQYAPVTEPRGVTRFHVLDPFGRLVNVLARVRT